MSWLDDMEAADPAYPDPDAAPWASPGYVPDTSRGLPAEIGNAIGEWARQENTRVPEPESAGPIGRDWRAARDAEARARESGLQATVRQPDGQDTPAWQADADAWGSGSGIAADGPEAGE